MKFSAIIVAAILGYICSCAEGTSCRRPRSLRKGRYEYQNSADYGLTHLPVNYIVRAVCEPDATLVGDEFIICQDNEQWSDYPYCHAPLVCFRLPESPANGYVRMRGKSARSIAVYRCNPGFELHGQRTVVCNEATGSWQGDVPRCFRPPSCPDPNEPSGMLALVLDESSGIKRGDLYTERTVFNYTCQTGYHLTGDVTITCQHGSWEADADVPECNKIICAPPTLEPIENGTHNIENRTYNVGEMVQYECNEGYLVDGISWQVCQSHGGPNGIWSDNVPSCKVARCPHPGSRHLDNGEISFSPRNGQDATNSWPVGTMMTLRCRSHLELLGSSERVCQPDGHWNGTLTSCHNEEYDCPALGNPIHGSKVGSPQYRVNTKVNFRCNHGYEMVGSEERMCTFSEEWTGEMPRCMGRDEFDELSRVMNGLGKTFDEIVIDGGSLVGRNDTSSNSGLRRKRTIKLSSGMDIYFAFDASNSVGIDNFRTGKRFAKLLVGKLQVNTSPGGTRVGAVSYSSEARRLFNVNDFTTTVNVVNAIEANVNYTNKGTNLPAALDTIGVMIAETAEESGYSSRKRILFIITDGFSNVGGAPSKSAQPLKEDAALKIHCIGISRNTDKTALAEIASPPVSEHVFYLSDYNKLERAVEAITSTNRSYEECGESKHPSGTSRIVGGDIAGSGVWPWQAALYDEDTNDIICGGSLIHKNWILTAAHCFIGDPIRTLSQNRTTVYLGLTHRVNDMHTGPGVRCEGIDYAPGLLQGLDDGGDHNDIALLRLDREAELGPFVRTVCLPPSDPKKANWFVNPNERTAYVTGWGRIKTGGVKSQDLLEIGIPPVLDSLCSSELRARGLAVDTTTELCAGSDGRDSCQGDSGGPMVVQRNNIYRQIGIVSYGAICGVTYGVYTRVTHYIDWIKGIIDN
ncbi:LOW QUALITY PROTEIN: sushi, von Willebrand factor type A, EGF and pentraxin domain-containing protein 1-like [Strongylocentrotus purpuratus]|uniref:C3/C5 convertase n=1 Tax=Strongylocentrotus purpuratus TaxID=7668 RepID=A0A7M7P471_STRPU|nr:LOW QUALITY PROTEIN: sushi, von Willebrand factor type A, EGF and pentraxin domain-containing protein 1-like [Strongylocentrotus purpuratus]